MRRRRIPDAPMSSDGAVPLSGAFRIGFIAALDVEYLSLRRASPGGDSWLLLQSGPGPTRAAAAAARALDAGARLLVSFGFAGALDAALVSGTVLAPRRVLAEGAAPLVVSPRWHARVAALADEFPLASGDLLTVPAALESPAAKRAAARASGAMAVDMESAAVAGAAASAGVPFVALRVVVDTLDDALPRGAEQWIDEQGNRRLAPVLRAVFSAGQWRPLVTLTRRYGVARRVLGRLAHALAARRVLAGDVGARS
jgi:nucleoside phosphorylase